LKNVAVQSDSVRKAASLFPAIRPVIQGARGAGFPNVVVDPDGVRRRIDLLKSYKGKYFAQLAFRPLLDWLGNPTRAFVAITVMDIWQWTPFCALIFLAGLSMVPVEIGGYLIFTNQQGRRAVAKVGLDSRVRRSCLAFGSHHQHPFGAPCLYGINRGAHALHRRIPAALTDDAQFDTRTLRDGNDRVAIPQIGGERLFDEDVRTGARGFDGRCGMRGMGRADHDCLDARVADHRRDVGVRLDAILPRKRGSAFRIVTAHRDEFRFGNRAKRLGV
jgi:hypothetical protein